MLDETTYYFTAFAIDQNNNIIDTQTLSITTDFWWHVTPNTLLYLPLDGDLIDKSANHNNWTWEWTAQYDDIIAWWTKKCAYFNSNSAIKLTSELFSWNPTFTNSCWVKTNSSGVSFMHTFWQDSWWRRSVLCMFYNNNKRPLQDTYWTDIYIWNATTSDLWGKWINIIYTYSWWTHKLYINWVLYWTWSWNLNISSWYQRYIWRKLGDLYGYCLADSIFENIVWSADDALNYYNKTKKKFGYT